MIIAGFECSTQLRRDGSRVDSISGTGHDRFARQDYALCAGLRLSSARDGLRWHRIETAPGRYDWTDWRRQLDAAEEAGVRVVWDLFHYGFPEFHEPAADSFGLALASFAAAAAEEHLRATGRPIDHCIANEIGFVCYSVGSGDFRVATPIDSCELKDRLIAAAIAAAEAIDSVGAGERLWAEPLIHVHPPDTTAESVAVAAAHTAGQFEVWDMIAGRRKPELGGRPGLLGTVGVNFYPHNQWYVTDQWYQGIGTVPPGHPDYRPLSDMLVEVSERYRRPLMVSETGMDGIGRDQWLRYVCDEVRSAMARGAEVTGICIYPITSYPAWSDGRLCDTGLFGPPDEHGVRAIDLPLLAEIESQQAIFGRCELERDVLLIEPLTPPGQSGV
jgi:hypothetical protein